MKTKLLLVLACFTLFLAAHTQADTLDDANRAFAEGHYHASTLDYQSVLIRKGYSAPVLFNLGNSYFSEGDFAHAILAYKRAQWLSPRDPDIAANLSLAQKRAGLPVSESRSSDQLTNILNATDWAWLGSGALALLCLSLFARTFFPGKRALFSISSVASTILLLAAMTAVAFSWNELHQAVVIDGNAEALISPFSAAQKAFVPVPGEILTMGKTYHDFILVRDAAGHTGWINETQIAGIIPPASAGKTL